VVSIVCLLTNDDVAIAPGDNCFCPSVEIDRESTLGGDGLVVYRDFEATVETSDGLFSTRGAGGCGAIGGFVGGSAAMTAGCVGGVDVGGGGRNNVSEVLVIRRRFSRFF